MIQCTIDQFNNYARNAYTLENDQVLHPAYVLYVIGHYERFCLTKNNIIYPSNPCHFKCVNDLYVVDDCYYDDKITNVAYFYLRRTSLQREYNGFDDECIEEYCVISIDRAQL